MVGGLLLLAVSLVVVAFAGINVRNCISRGAASAYGHAYSRAENPAAFWLSVTCSVVAILIGVALSLAALSGLFGLI